MFRLGLWIFPWILATTAWGQDPAGAVTPTSEEVLNEATTLFQSGQFDAAAKKFQQYNDFKPDIPAVLSNWGLSEYQAGRRGLAVGLWRRALSIDPDEQSARLGLEFATRALQLSTSQDDLWLENIRRDWLSRVSLNQLLGLCVIFLALGGWRLATYFGRRRVALRDEQPLPPFSWAGGLIAVLFIFTFAMTALKGVDSYIARGTITSSVPVRTAPNEASSSIFELREGADVVLRQATKGWTQVRQPGGMSGWVPQSTLFQTSGMPLW